ncbi:MAG: hypothetical protein Q8942_05500 [Bacillota bacterium]|nr:hypothetical protein [Bacillota bacterium]
MKIKGEFKLSMRPMNISKEKARCKAINLLWKKEFNNNLLNLHEADFNDK